MKNNILVTSGKAVVGLLVFLTMWFGSAFLGVQMFGQESNAIIVVAVVGFFIGAQIGLSIVFGNPYKKVTPKN